MTHKVIIFPTLCVVVLALFLLNIFYGAVRIPVSGEMAGEANAVRIGGLADEIMEAVSYPLLEELPEYVPDDNAAGRIRINIL